MNLVNTIMHVENDIECPGQTYSIILYTKWTDDIEWEWLALQRILVVFAKLKKKKREKGKLVRLKLFDFEINNDQVIGTFHFHFLHSMYTKTTWTEWIYSNLFFF